MSIEYELFKHIGKKPCSPNSPRAVRCPLVINETSEDLLMCNIFGRLKYLNPRTWLIPFLETIFKGKSFSSIAASNIKIEFWQKLPAPPTTSHREGIEEIDIVIRIRHLIILIECKFKGAVHMGHSGRDRDQLARYIDAATFNYWSDSSAKREIYLILLTDTEAEPEILSRYRNPETVLACLTQDRPFVDYEQASQRLARNIGWVTWRDILAILELKNLKEVSPVEAMIIKDLIQYLKYKFDRR
jgi:hypothetical protein